MAERIKPVEAAKRLGTPPQRIYNLIKQGRVKTFANPNGKVALVDFAEVKMVLGQVKTRGPKGTKTKGVLPRGLARGAIITSPKAPIKGAFARPDGGGKHVRTVVDATSNIVWLSDGSIETIWPTDSLSEALKSGRARIETPAAVLGLILYQWRHDGLELLANELAEWLVDKGVGFYPITTPHDFMTEDNVEPPPHKYKEVEVELGVDASTIDLDDEPQTPQGQGAATA